jgi:hypothetical protein
MRIAARTPCTPNHATTVGRRATPTSMSTIAESLPAPTDSATLARDVRLNGKDAFYLHVDSEIGSAIRPLGHNFHHDHHLQHHSTILPIPSWDCRLYSSCNHDSIYCLPLQRLPHATYPQPPTTIRVAGRHLPTDHSPSPSTGPSGASSHISHKERISWAPSGSD